MKSLSRDSFTVLIFRLMTLATSLGVGVLGARHLGPEGWGFYTLFTFGANLYLIVFGGISAALAYQISKGRKPNIVVAYSLVLACAFGMIGLISAVVISAFLRGEGSSLWIPIGIGAPFALAASFLQGIFVGSHDLYGLAMGGMLPSLITLGAMGLLFSLGQGTPLRALSAWAMGHVVAACWTIARARSAWGSPLLGKLDRALFRELLFFGAQVSVVNFVTFLNYRVDLFWIRYFLDLEAVGFYSVAILSAEGLWLFSSAIATAAYARIGRASLNEAGTLTARATRHALFVIGLAAVSLFFTADWLLPWVYGTRYLDSIVPFKILVPGVAVYGAAGILSAFFTNHLGRPFIPLSIASFALAANVLLSPLLVPRFGMAGGAWATTASYTAAIGLALWIFVRISGHRLRDALVIQRSDLIGYGILAYDLLLSLLKVLSILSIARQEARRPRVLLLGYPYFIKMIGDLLPRDLVDVRINNPRRVPRAIRDLFMADVVYIIGGSLNDWRRLATSRLARGRVVMHWVGTDVLLARAVQAKGKACRYLKSRITHWAEVPWTAEELEQIGIKAHVVPLTSTRFPLKAPCLPEVFTILAYLKDLRPEFYGAVEIRRLAADFPEIRFLVVGSSGDFMSDKPSNMEFLGWVEDMGSVYPQSTTLVRMTDHDGLAFMVLESLAYGRYVIWSYRFDGVFFAKDYDVLKDHVQQLFTRHKAGRLPLNEAGIRKVQAEFDPSVVGRRLALDLMNVAFIPRRSQ